MSHWEIDGKTDEWYTPKYIFDALGCEFDTDVAAPKDRSYCDVPANKFICENSLDLEWKGFVWMNPPFGKRNGILPWLNKIYKHGNGIALTPDRTSAPWWQQAAKQSDAVLFISGKIRFIRSNGMAGDSPSTGTTLFAYGDQAVTALKQAYQNDLGILFLLFKQQ